MLTPKQTGSFISRLSKHVSIKPKGIKAVCNEISKEIERKQGAWADNLEQSGKWAGSNCQPGEISAETLNWIFVVNALNFSFWTETDQFIVYYNGRPNSGYMALCACVNKAIKNGIPLTDAEYFCQISWEEMNQIFSGEVETDTSPKTIPMLKERWDILQQDGKVLLEKFGGNFEACVQEANKSAKKLLDIIINNFPSFRDVSVYQNTEVSFLKRAQILVVSVHRAYEGVGLGEFDDINDLTMFADYRVPQVLVHFGALEYSPELMQRLKSHTLLPQGSDMENEVRGCSIQAVEEIVQMVNAHFDGTKRVSAPDVDYFLWTFRRRYNHDVSKIPFHRTRTIYY